MDMDMGMTSTGAMDATATMDMPQETSTAAMDMDMGMGNGCQISMLWNWQVDDACFISESWHITSKGMFAGSCIGVILLVISLEFLRRSVKEFDRYLVKQHVSRYNADADSVSASADERSGPHKNDTTTASAAATASCTSIPPFRPNVWQQAIRALLHMLQFAVAYFVMLLAMYYNGYIIICIFIGAYLGAFVFHWEPLAIGGEQTSAAKEATVCCG